MNELTELQKKLVEIQNELVVLKSQSNKDIRFQYRTADDILAKVKPLCKERDVLLTLTDDVKNVGAFNYVTSAATVSKGEESISCSGLSKEPLTLMKMSAPQITGSCSSYARKTALGGLFMIDNNPDPDSNSDHSDYQEATIEQYNEIAELKQSVTPQQRNWVDNEVKKGLSFKDAQIVINNMKGGKQC